MKNDLENIIIKAVRNIIENSISDKKIKKLKEKRNNEIHFIKVLELLFQSVNIQFENFIK